MKTIFALLLSTISFAQIQMPDTILLVDGRSAACLVTSIEDEKYILIIATGQSQ